MDLLPQAIRDVKEIMAANGEDLRKIRTYLDLSVQESGGYWEEPNVDFVSIDPSVRAGHVRQLTAGQVSRQSAKAPALRTLRLKVLSFAGLHLYTGQGRKIRVRNRPFDRRTGRPIRALDAEYRPEPMFGEDLVSIGKNATLFGYDPSALPYEISVLMSVDLATKTLIAAALAAIDWGPDDKGREIYYEEEIPATPMAGFGDGGADDTPTPPGGWGGEPGSGFEDLLRDEEEGTGSGPA